MTYFLQRFYEQDGQGGPSLQQQISQFFALNPACSIRELYITHKEGSSFASNLVATIIGIYAGSQLYCVEFVSVAGSTADAQAAAFFAANPTFNVIDVANTTGPEKRYLQRNRILVIYSVTVQCGATAAASQMFAAQTVATTGAGNRLTPTFGIYDVIQIENLGNMTWPAGGRALAFRNSPLFGSSACGWAGVAPCCYSGSAPASTTTTTTTTTNAACLLSPFAVSSTVTPPPNPTTKPPFPTSTTTSSTTSTTSTTTTSTTSTSTTSTTTTPPPFTTTSTTTTTTTSAPDNACVNCANDPVTATVSGLSGPCSAVNGTYLFQAYDPGTCTWNLLESPSNVMQITYNNVTKVWTVTIISPFGTSFFSGNSGGSTSIVCFGGILTGTAACPGQGGPCNGQSASVVFS